MRIGIGKHSQELSEAIGEISALLGVLCILGVLALGMEIVRLLHPH